MLSEIPSGESIFIDTNIFLYSAFEHPVFGNICKDFLKRTQKREIAGFSSDFVLNEAFHKLMIAEVANNLEIDGIKAVGIIKRKPELIKELKRVWVEMELINSFNIMILSSSTYPKFIDISKRYRLMAMDAAHVAIMFSNGIKNIATNDDDFERIEGFKLWKPLA